MGAIVHLAIKDLRLLLRDRFGLFWVIAFPFLMALFFGSIFGGGGGSTRGMKIAVVTDSLMLAPSQSAEKFYTQLEKSSALSVQRMMLDSAKAAVAKGNLVAYVEYRPGGLEGQPFAMFAPKGGPEIEVGIDPSRRAETGYLQGLVNQAYFAQMQGMFDNTQSWRSTIGKQLGALDTASSIDQAKKKSLRNLYSGLDNIALSIEQIDSVEAAASQQTGVTDSAAAKPKAGFGNVDIKFTDVAVNRTGPRSAFEITFPQSLQWALIGCAAAFAISIVVERTRGTFMRLRLAPISRAHILAGKGLACFASSVFVSLLLLAVGWLAFGVRILSPLNLGLAILASAYCFVGLMMLISVLGKTEQAVAGSGWGILMVFAMTGGGMVPLMFMPSWMSKIGSISPVKWSMLSFEGAIWRGFTLTDMMTPVIILLAYGTVAFLIGVVILKRYGD